MRKSSNRSIKAGGRRVTEVVKEEEKEEKH